MRIKRNRAVFRFLFIILMLSILCNLLFVLGTNSKIKGKETLETKTINIQAEIEQILESYKEYTEKDYPTLIQLQTLVPATKRQKEFFINDILPIKLKNEVEILSFKITEGVIDENSPLTENLNGLDIRILDCSIAINSYNEKSIYSFIEDIQGIERIIHINEISIVKNDNDFITYSSMISFNIFYIISEDYKNKLESIYSGEGEEKDFLFD